MERTTLCQILEHTDDVARQGRGEPLVLRIPSGTAVTFFIEAGPEFMTIARVVQIGLPEQHVALTTHQGAEFFFPYARIAGFKIEPSEERKRERGAGFV